MSDHYCYPGTDVLKNKVGARDQRELERIERLASLQRLRHLPSVPLTYDGYKALHRHIFRDVYEWAGQPRNIRIAKRDLFCLPEHIDHSMQDQFKRLAHENNLKNLPPNKFAERAAHYMAEINAVHPFREGNGRTQRAFLKLLAREAGYDLDLRRIARAAWMNASLKGHRGELKPMQELIEGALAARRRKYEAGLAESGKDESAGKTVARQQKDHRGGVGYGYGRRPPRKT